MKVGSHLEKRKRSTNTTSNLAGLRNLAQEGMFGEDTQYQDLKHASRRDMTFEYKLKNADGTDKQVCKKFSSENTCLSSL